MEYKKELKSLKARLLDMAFTCTTRKQTLVVLQAKQAVSRLELTLEGKRLPIDDRHDNKCGM